MAFVIPKNPESPTSTSTSSYEEERPAITSYVTLRPPTPSSCAARPPLEKEMVLSRIRHRKIVNRLNGALQSFLAARAESSEEGRQSTGGWLDDAFSP
ncbi:hypothetical protein HPP92_006889 [Vanilla planifolia]|uniref:Uncharacterized protein n=1 Tax=Vanilla planifolia TaxID=51239 RepID=A0A835RCZ9_VANPL|nr:hypothetical protein HPP92_007123 [Vanilla planifolia]KAG0490026.1 hypothetical protein HPP92_006889 [Vanilla planifolia]